ncbi:PLP-dependent transferase [Lindgomyces ingoldianus]|uniref:PLP-dependent transferase n=1 Tax=Lindgomyces ingoldianus TaxID=673940 RepID=A0ACB6R755_9PLEO|nr:PLP-dependent transferase [Lindgomyces ingoldianus]KAF2474155.1 PLP-dependent transferase [Lindgomyces ingoldianus]
MQERLAYNEKISLLRDDEYPMLKGITYLDHAGTSLYSKSLIDAFSREMMSQVLGNPHSTSTSALNTSQRIQDVRIRALKLFRADPEHFDIIFTANATAAIKLVLEAFAGYKSGFSYRYHRDSHTSLVGGRELASRSQCFASDTEVEMWMNRRRRCSLLSLFKTKKSHTNPSLFAYPAQSNMNGRRLPLTWPSKLRNSSHQNAYTLLDAAALVSTSPLDLSDHTTSPDFTVLSFYKIFGFPDLGCLIVRKASAHVFEQRKYFGGGTTEMVTVSPEQWFVRKENSLHERMEDGTLAIRSIIALGCAIDVHERLFGGLDKISTHTGFLAKYAYSILEGLRYENGRPVCQIYKGERSTYGDQITQGASIAMNLLHSDGSWISSSTVQKLAKTKDIHIRTGSLCNPGGMAQTLGLGSVEIKRAFAEGFRCGQEADVRAGVPMGMVRISFGAMSTVDDIEMFIQFLREEFVDSGGEGVGEKGVGGSSSQAESCDLKA